MDTEEMLADLDRFAVKCNFPVLDNVHVALADSRLTAFRGVGRWAIVFEVVGFSEPEMEFVDDIYAYGNCVACPGFQGERIVASQVEGKSIRDPVTNDCIANRQSWSLFVDGQERSFSPTAEQYSAAGLVYRPPGPGSISEREMLRFLVHTLGHRFFASTEELLVYVSPCQASDVFVQTLAWQHPDIAHKELPSQSVAFRSLVASLASGDPRLFDPGKPNTDWKNWTDGS